MKILLVYLCDGRDRRDYFISLVPTGLVALAAFLESRGHAVTLANYSDLGWRRAAAAAARRRPGLVGVSIFTHNRTDSFRFIRALKRLRPETVIVAGGPHVSALAAATIRRYPELAYLVRGEGEAAVLDLLARVAAGTPETGVILDGKRVDGLDALPSPAAFTGKMIGVDAAKQFSVVITSRGCPDRCRFCGSPWFWSRRVRFRSPESILAELRLIRKRFGLREFSIRDDNFTLDRNRVLEFCRLLRRSGLRFRWSCQARVDTVDAALLTAMRQAGLEQIQLGVESGSPRILAKLGKRITPAQSEAAVAAARAAGVGVTIYLMTGMAGETAADFAATRALLDRLQPDAVVVSPVAYYPGTALYATARRAGTVRDRDWFVRRASGWYVRNDRVARRWPQALQSGA